MTKTTKCLIRFEPDGRTASVDAGTSILEAAAGIGIYLGATCGGAGTCGACQVIIKEGRVEEISPGENPLGQIAGAIRACQSRALTDLVIEIPSATPLETAVLARECTLESSELLATGWSFAPILSKVCLTLPPPSASDNSCDLDRLQKGLKDSGAPCPIDAPLEVLRDMGAMLRAGTWQITATLLPFPGHTKIVRLEPGDTRTPNLALAFDIGTTAVRGQLLDLERGSILASAVDYNGQIPYGADVISRIIYCQNPGGLDALQSAVTATLNKLIREMLDQAGAPVSSVNHITVAANTVMTHILLGINPQSLRLSPYVPVVSEISPVKGVELGLSVAEHAYVSFLPSVASYVGGDVVAGIIGTGIYQQNQATLYIDIGTNGEIVAGARDWMVTTAASAGPTFEGGGIRCGTLATKGAIDSFKLSSASNEPTLTTIGHEAPQGICGAGLIAISAAMLRTGLIDQGGRFNPDITTPRLRRGPDGQEYVLVWGSESQTGNDIVITELDLNNLIRSKAAIYAGCQTLLGSIGFDFNDLDRVVIAGSLGCHIGIEEAITIGLLPDLPRERFVFVGNSSLLGARLTSFSTALMGDARRISRLMTSIELSENADFMTNYMAALFLPHTNNRELFPSVRLEVPS